VSQRRGGGDLGDFLATSSTEARSRSVPRAITEITTTERPSPAPESPWRGRALGLVLESSEPFPGAQAAPGVHAGRVTAWREESAEAIDNKWKLGDGDLLLDRRHSDGRLFLRVDGHDAFGFRVWAPYYGRHLVSRDGSSIASALPSVPPARWQRLFFAQVLPLASALNGLCLFHGSAVALGGQVVAFVGPSGSGRTSLTAQLVALGASFVTDDVLAVETADAAVVVHPGPARLSIDEAELRRVPSTQLPRLGPCVARSDKLVCEPAPVPGPLPLTRVYLLRRVPTVPGSQSPNERHPRADRCSATGTSAICAPRAFCSATPTPAPRSTTRSVRTTSCFRPAAGRAMPQRESSHTPRSSWETCGSEVVTKTAAAPRPRRGGRVRRIRACSQIVLFAARSHPSKGGKRAFPLGLREIARLPGRGPRAWCAPGRTANGSRPRPARNSSPDTVRNKWPSAYWSASRFGLRAHVSDRFRSGVHKGVDDPP
jgi:hypothetical protein